MNENIFVIKHNSGLYFHNKGRIILFESQQEAENFINMFVNYSMQRLASEGRAQQVMQVPIVCMHECSIIPIDFDINNIECGTIYSKELFDKER